VLQFDILLDGSKSGILTITLGNSVVPIGFCLHMAFEHATLSRRPLFTAGLEPRKNSDIKPIVYKYILLPSRVSSHSNHTFFPQTRKQYVEKKKHG